METISYGGIDYDSLDDFLDAYGFERIAGWLESHVKVVSVKLERDKDTAMFDINQSFAQVDESLNDLKVRIGATEADLRTWSTTMIAEAHEISTFAVDLSRLRDSISQGIIEDVKPRLGDITNELRSLSSKVADRYVTWLDLASSVSGERYSQQELLASLSDYVRELRLWHEKFSDIIGDGESYVQVIDRLSGILEKLLSTQAASSNKMVAAAVASSIPEYLKAMKSTPREVKL